MQRRELLERLGAGGALIALGQAGSPGPIEATKRLPNVGAVSLVPAPAAGHRLADIAPELEKILRRSAIVTPPRYGVAEIRFQTVMVPMRDGIRCATDLYLPPKLPAPAIAFRTPYGRAEDLSAGGFV